MLKIIRKFLAFCDAENRKKFHIAIVYGIILAFFEAVKIPAIAIMMNALIEGNIGTEDILYSFLMMLISIGGVSICDKKATMLQTEAGYGTCADKRLEIAKHMRYLPMGYFNQNSLGMITSVTTNTMSALENVATRVILLVSQGILTTALIVIVLFFFDVRIALILLAGSLLFLLVNSLMQRASGRVSSEKVQVDTALIEQVLEYIQGISEVRAYGLAGKESSRLKKAIDENSSINTRMELTFVPYTIAQNLILRLTGVAMVFFSILYYLHGTMDLFICVMMIISSFIVYSSLETAGSYSALLRVVDLSVDRAQEILSIEPMDISGEDLKPSRMDLAAHDISFSYEKKNIIDHISLNIPEHTTTAFVGPSGGGKTTLASLLARFWDVDSGNITLDRLELQEYSMDSLMKNYSFVFQDVYLFHDTIANNIRFGKPDAPVSEVIEAAKKACCHDFINALPDGYETVIGEGGADLSGGERQRISIARAIMKDSPIVILDEATANVDPENEADLMQAIEALTKEKTIIMIAHRLKTVRNADQILVVDHGHLVQRGRHDELMQQDGIYRRFVEDRKEAVGWKIKAKKEKEGK